MLGTLGRSFTAGYAVPAVLQGRFERPSSAGFSHFPVSRYDRDSTDSDDQGP